MYIYIYIYIYTQASVAIPKCDKLNIMCTSMPYNTTSYIVAYTRNNDQRPTNRLVLIDCLVPEAR